MEKGVKSTEPGQGMAEDVAWIKGLWTSGAYPVRQARLLLW